jgi:hypothetical protein
MYHSWCSSVNDLSRSSGAVQLRPGARARFKVSDSGSDLAVKRESRCERRTRVVLALVWDFEALLIVKEPPQRVVARVGLLATRSLRRVGLRMSGGVLAVESRDSLWPVGGRAGGAEEGRRERAMRNGGGGGGGDGREGRGSGEGGARYCLHSVFVCLWSSVCGEKRKSESSESAAAF